MKNDLEDICYELDVKTVKYQAVAPEIVMTSTFYYDDMQQFIDASRNEINEFMYTRGGNPTTYQLEQKLARIEQGERCKVFASGMGAISATLFGLLNQGDHVLILNTIYSTAQSYIDFLRRYGVSYNVVNTTSVEVIAKHIKPETRVIYIESPSTQKFEMVDLEAVAKLAKEHSIKTVIDNTWATPLYQQPLTKGIDISIHSLSKYIGGHSDIVGGAIIGSNEDIESIERTGFMFLGSTCSPMNSFLALRGLRTLPLRMQRHDENIRAIIDVLQKDSRVEKIYHPYAQQRDLSEKQLGGYGSLMAVTFSDKDVTKLERFVNNLSHFVIGVSWGAYESMVLPGYKGDNVEKMKQRGLDITHTRLFIGLTSSDALINDIKQALDLAYGKEK